jgi:hypothetical protein
MELVLGELDAEQAEAVLLEADVCKRVIAELLTQVDDRLPGTSMAAAALLIGICGCPRRP